MLCSGGIARANTLAEMAQFIGVRGIPGSLVAGISTQLAVFKKFAGGWIENQKGRRFRAILQRQCFAEVSKTFHLHWLHIKCLTESRKGQQFLRGPQGIGGGDVVFDLFVIRPACRE